MLKNKHNEIVKNLNEKMAGTESKLLESSEEIVKLADEILVLKEVVDKKTQEIEFLNQHVANFSESEVQIELDRLNAELSRLNGQLNEKDDLETVGVELLEEQHLIELENVKKELTSLIKLNATLQKELNSAATNSEVIENKISAQEKQGLIRYEAIQKLENEGFTYKYFTTNQFGEEMVVGAKEKGYHLVVKLFYSDPTQARENLPTTSVRLLSSHLYDYRILHHDTTGNPNLEYDVEVKTAVGEAKIAKYTSGYLEQLDSNSDIGSGNGKLLLEAIVSELKLRGINSISGDLTAKHQPNFVWLKQYLIKQGFTVPAEDQLGKVIKII